MKRIFTLFFLLFSSLFIQKSFSQATYRSVASGNWETAATWESSTDNISWTTPSGAPGTTNDVIVRTGHNVVLTGSGRNCKNLTIETGASLKGSASSLALRINGTTLTNNGTFGGAASTEALVIELPTSGVGFTLTGTGTATHARFRSNGGNANTPVLNYNQDITFTQSANYAVSIVYNPTATDNYTLNIGAGKTVTISNATGYFHNNAVGSGSGFGTYTYNINGTLDNSANLGTANTTTFQPLGAGSTVNLNISGVYKTGTFNTSTNSGSAGTVNLTVKTGGRLELVAGGTYVFVPEIPIKTEGTGVVMRNVAAADALFPVGFGTSYNPVTLNNSGTSDNFSVSVKGTIDNAVSDATKVVNRQWTISEAVAGGSTSSVKLAWLTADQASGFNPANPVVIARWTGSAWQTFPATVTGTGVLSDPYVATATGVSSFSQFIVANASALPVSFADNKAFAKDRGVQVEWTTATESNIKFYSVERSVNGKEFASIATVESKGNSATATSYSYFDASPVAGINYYRIKALDKDGSFKYTSIMQVNISRSKAEVVIAPNPVRNGKLNIQLSGLAKGTYTVRVFNNSGQVVFSTQIAAEAGSLSRSFRLPATVRTGVYNLQVTGNDLNLNKKLVLE